MESPKRPKSPAAARSAPVTRSLMLIAGEASGDTLGAELVRELQESATRGGPVAYRFFGAGGPKMEAAGVTIDFDLTGHAVVGIWEVLKNYSKFKSFFDRLLALARAEKPDGIVLIDYPGFNLRFARAIKARAARAGEGRIPRIVYYVSPQIWAWHESRVKQIARDVDLLLAIFPFEEEWYARRAPQLKVKFVGHPLLDRYSEFRPGATQGSASKSLVLLLPGSRKRELKKHLAVMVAAAKRIAANHPVRFRMVLPDDRLAQLVGTEVAGLEGLELRIGDLAESLAEADLAIAASGTVTMECAYFRVPTVVLYKTSWSTYELARRLVKVKYIAMPNLLAGEMIYPEFIQNAASSENIAREGLELLQQPARRNNIRIKLTQVIDSLGGSGASRRAAAAVSELLAKP